MRCPVGFGPLFLLGESWRKFAIRAVVMDSGSIADRVRTVAEQAAIDHGLELVHVEIAGPEGHPIIRVFIDKPGGVTHEDCSGVSTQIGTVLDVEDFIHSAYTLEVSSPGLERGLYKLADYQRFAGSTAKLKTRAPIKNQRNFQGRISGVENQGVVFEDRTSGRIMIPFDSIVKANLEIDVENEFRQAREREAVDRDLIDRNRR
ncbi:MAG: ribosome maturation factor [Acidobacteria bacterium]|nr:MAG: ribosome maturation factor [Acidobacteriota bacterium]